jgi:uncharacterized alkaline shock family protein YloU
VEGHATISSDILASYAGDAAREVPGVAGLVEIHVVVDWGARIPEVGRAVQREVAAYLGRMADVEPASVDVVVDEIARP